MELQADSKTTTSQLIHDIAEYAMARQASNGRSTLPIHFDMYHEDSFLIRLIRKLVTQFSS